MSPIKLRSILWFAIGALLVSAPARGGGLEVWNTTELTLRNAGRLRWSVFGVVRTRNHLTHAYDFRLGSQLAIVVSPRFSVTTGYLRRRLDPTRLQPHWENRVYATPSVILAARPLEFKALSIVERNFGIPGGPGYNRYRPRVELERRRKRISPFLAEEFTFRREGFVRSRSAAGVRWRAESNVTFEVAYQFDTIRTGQAWRPRHALRTVLTFGLPQEQH
ncbi:MAG: DUF2490 domain-containing protein [Bryobacterales bacterium]|nr:DUF2490 domain-containing protein [Bryobacteraceae bacterium]MDW8354073.1 DUF2490 domain-containing protein [Bryobacterales bacterium]